MSFFQLGSIIRNRREELGYSQEELADGICSVPTLSRIENGERMPTKNHYEMLMQRLGYGIRFTLLDEQGNNRELIGSDAIPTNPMAYICVIMDLYARRVIAYKVGYSNNTHLVIETFRMAYESRKPEPGLIFYTDQGGNYRSRAFSDYLKAREVTQSFSKPGVPYDNSVMETFFASMKREELYRYKYRSEREFRAAVDRYIEFYNTKRPHKTLHYKTPVQKEENYARGPRFYRIDNLDKGVRIAHFS